MANKTKKGEWINSRGTPIHPGKIKPDAKRKDRLVEQILSDASRLHEKMRQAKREYMEIVNEYIEFLQDENDVERSGKGNLILSNFSNTKQVEIKVNDIFVFDEKLQIAKQIIDNCIVRWSKNANSNLKALVDSAFKVDRKGNIDKHAIKSLTQLNITDAAWEKAMKLINDSLTVTGTKQYMTIKERDSIEGKWHTINLNFSTI